MKATHLSLFGFLLATNLFAATSAGWRGNGTGAFPDQNPPTRWSRDSNIAWKVEMPDRSNAHPVIAGNRVFVASEPFDLLCLRLSDGKLLWRRSNDYRDVTDDASWKRIQIERESVARIRMQQESLKSRIKPLEGRNNRSDEEDAQLQAMYQQLDDYEKKLDQLPLGLRYTLPVTQKQYNGYTTATPTSDGRHVWAVFGNRVVVCYDMNGQRQWSAVLPDNPQSMWGHSSSPLLVGNRLVVNIEGIVGFDALTGKQAWRTKYGQSWGSAVHGRIGKTDVAFFANGRVVRLTDGKVLTRVPTTLADASPTVHQGVAYYVGTNAFAFPFPTEAGDSLTLDASWNTSQQGSRFYASAVVHDGLIYSVSTNYVLNVREASTGKTVYVKRLELGREPVWASVCVAGSFVYVSSRDGVTLVLRTGREFKQVARNTLAYFISTPVFHRNQIYIRTSKHLYCIGRETQP